MRRKPYISWLAGSIFVLLSMTILVHAQSISVKSHQKISNIEGNFNGILDNDDGFGYSVSSLGDLNGDGINDLAVGVGGDDDGGTNRGAIYILFLKNDGTVNSHQKISDTEGNFSGVLDNNDHFGGRTAGSAITPLDDLDGDGVTDIAVGATEDDDGGTNRGAVWILFLNSNGTVKSHQKISDIAGGFTGSLGNNYTFGNSVASLGDLNGDGITDLAVGAAATPGPGSLSVNAGAIWILFLNTNGTVNSHQKISEGVGGFTGNLNAVATKDEFGRSVNSLGDLDGDNITELAVGAYQDDDGGQDRGAVYILFMNTNGTVKSHQKISNIEGGFSGILENGDRFGGSVSSMGDFDGDGVVDLTVGASHSNDGGADRGAVYLLLLNATGTVKSHQKISNNEGGFTGILDNDDRFGHSINSMGDFDSDGIIDLAVGALRDDDGGANRGAVWLLFLNREHQAKIDIKPGNSDNKINLKSRGVIPVAVMTTHISNGDASNFDATMIDPLTVKFGPSRASEAHNKNHQQDIDGDGDMDVVLHFRTQATGIQCGDTEATLTGKTTDGQAFSGTDAIHTIGCGSAQKVSTGIFTKPLLKNYVLHPNYPNPFNPNTTISYQLANPGHVELTIYNTIGQKIRTLVSEQQSIKPQQIQWDGLNEQGDPVAGGIYLYQLKSGNYVKINKMVLLR